jgi:hypothetical protein
MFARKVSAERIIETFGMDPAAALLVPADGVSVTSRDSNCLSKSVNW